MQPDSPLPNIVIAVEWPVAKQSRVALMLDSGRALSLLKKVLYLLRVDYRYKTLIQCVHGDQKPQPMAELTVEVQD